ncbi:hypothetical protein [Gymnodinialimonas ulvae]|uniref:hypothetical protein n=1 Tax=Gymnodinialimonas ulvae TaxID=3126504 RepID=UPI0030B5795C
MTSRLTNRSDTPTAALPDRSSERKIITQTSGRVKTAGTARSKHLSTRTEPRTAQVDSGMMDYQQGFTSGPSM